MSLRFKVLFFIVFIAAVFVPVAGYPAGDGVQVGYLGYQRYSLFTRVVFDTGGAAPEGFKVGYDEVGRKVVFALVNGSLAFKFKPVDKLDDTVTAIDYIQVQPGKLGVLLRLSRKALGFRVSYLYRPNRLVLDIYRQTQYRPFMPVNRDVKTIAIDPGHGGTSLGAVGEGALAEADVVYKLSVKLKSALEADGFRVILTRDADKGPDAVDREGLANSERADLYISLHAAVQTGRGVASVFAPDEGTLGDGASGSSDAPMQWSEQNAVYLPESTMLARRLAEQMKPLTGDEPSVRYMPLYGLEGLSMPAVMVEFEGLGGSGLGASLANGSYLDKLADILARGIKSYAGGM
jgi:N-acetylmuramoyl-L-alanine amidase